jgi:hypothetical protein
MTTTGPEPEGRPGVLRRWGPVGLLSAALIALAVAVVVTAPSDGVATGGATTSIVGAGRTLPVGVVPFRVAEQQGRVDEIDWGERCDTEEGVLRIALSPPPECFAPFVGDNGGATAPGVTDRAIKVVVYLSRGDDPILQFIYRQIGNTDTPDKVWATAQGFNELLGRYMETYGRRVELIRYDATGDIGDAVAATADAETIARDIRPFVVLGGPNLTEAFADTLAANRVMCISCTPGQRTEWYAERSPYVWDVVKNTDQNLRMVAEYITKRLGGRAEYGGEDVRGRDRVLGMVAISSSPASDALRAEFLAQVRAGGKDVVEVATFTDPIGLAAQAREILARMKARGITTVLYSGDPLAPQALTRTATEQGYFPEWVIMGTTLVDTTIFGRTYDQAQWRHAFGPSNLFARVSPEVAGAGHLYRWYFGTPPPAQQVALVLPNLQLLYAVLQGMGPAVSPEQFRDVLFSNAPIPGSVIAPHLSWGDKGLWPGLDFAGVDDQTEVWWDADATCTDEVGNTGVGCWAYAAGGRRYLPGQWPVGEPPLFDRSADSVVVYDELPPGVVIPDYEPLPR